MLRTHRASLVLAALVGCAHEHDVPPTTVAVTRVTGAEISGGASDDAIVRIATARCEREQACNKIGSGRAYDDQATCLAEMGELADEEAGQTACPDGVDPLEVSRCLLDIRATRCGGELERSPNIVSCTKVVLCKH